VKVKKKLSKLARILSRDTSRNKQAKSGSKGAFDVNDYLQQHRLKHEMTVFQAVTNRLFRFDATMPPT